MNSFIHTSNAKQMAGQADQNALNPNRNMLALFDIFSRSNE
jgi:hypothetical protein